MESNHLLICAQEDVCGYLTLVFVLVVVYVYIDSLLVWGGAGRDIYVQVDAVVGQWLRQRAGRVAVERLEGLFILANFAIIKP